MKKLISLLLILTLALSFTGCKKSETEAGEKNEPSSENQLSFEGEVLTGIVYSVFGDGTKKENEIYFEGGEISIQRIAAGLTGATGLAFKCNFTVSEETPLVTVEFTSDSSFETGTPLREVDGYSFDSKEEIQEFMADSLRESIVKNFPDYEVKFTFELTQAQ